jgi:hypothetical protein
VTLRAVVRLSGLSVAVLAGGPAWAAPIATEVRIVTEPEGAEVFVGGARLGVAPRGGFRLVARAAGRITFSIRKDGYLPVERSVTVEGRETGPVVVRVRLEPVPAAEAAAPAPSGAAKARTPPAGPAPPRTATATSPPPRSSAKGGSHKGLILGVIGGAAAAGAGVAAVANRNTGAPSSTTAAPPTLSGTYSGSVQDSRGAGGPVTLVLTHATPYVTGTWHGPEPVWRALNGTVTGNAIAGTLLPSASTACPFRLSATVSGDRMTGTFSSFECASPVSGTLDLTRQ